MLKVEPSFGSLPEAPVAGGSAPDAEAIRKFQEGDTLMHGASDGLVDSWGAAIKQLGHESETAAPAALPGKKDEATAELPKARRNAENSSKGEAPAEHSPRLQQPAGDRGTESFSEKAVVETPPPQIGSSAPEAEPRDAAGRPPAETSVATSPNEPSHEFQSARTEERGSTDLPKHPPGRDTMPADKASATPVSSQTTQAPEKPDVAPGSQAAHPEVKPTEVKPTEVKPTEVKPTEVKPTEVKPTEVKPTEVKPTEVKPTEVKPAAARVESPSEPPSRGEPRKAEGDSGSPVAAQPQISDPRVEMASPRPEVGEHLSRPVASESAKTDMTEVSGKSASFKDSVPSPAKADPREKTAVSANPRAAFDAPSTVGPQSPPVRQTTDGGLKETAPESESHLMSDLPGASSQPSIGHTTPSAPHLDPNPDGPVKSAPSPEEVHAFEKLAKDEGMSSEAPLSDLSAPIRKKISSPEGGSHSGIESELKEALASLPGLRQESAEGVASPEAKKPHLEESGPLPKSAEPEKTNAPSTHGSVQEASVDLSAVKPESLAGESRPISAEKLPVDVGAKGAPLSSHDSAPHQSATGTGTEAVPSPVAETAVPVSKGDTGPAPANVPAERTGSPAPTIESSRADEGLMQASPSTTTPSARSRSETASGTETSLDSGAPQSTKDSGTSLKPQISSSASTVPHSGEVAAGEKNEAADPVESRVPASEGPAPTAETGHPSAERIPVEIAATMAASATSHTSEVDAPKATAGPVPSPQEKVMQRLNESLRQLAFRGVIDSLQKAGPEPGKAAVSLTLPDSFLPGTTVTLSLAGGVLEVGFQTNSLETQQMLGEVAREHLASDLHKVVNRSAISSVRVTVSDRRENEDSPPAEQSANSEKVRETPRQK